MSFHLVSFLVGLSVGAFIMSLIFAWKGSMDGFTSSKDID